MLLFHNGYESFLLVIDLVPYLRNLFFRLVKKVPFVRRKIAEELEKTKQGLEEDIVKSNKGSLYIERIPNDGIKYKDVLKMLDDYMQMNEMNWKNGAVSGCIFGADDELTELTTQVFTKFAWSNRLHADVFPEIRKMEAEVVRMVCTMFHGDEETCGAVSVTSELF